MYGNREAVGGDMAHRRLAERRAVLAEAVRDKGRKELRASTSMTIAQDAASNTLAAWY